MKRIIKTSHPNYKIVADGGMSSPIVGEGRFIPALIIDAEEKISELIQLHKDLPPGDTNLRWFLQLGYFSPKSIHLDIEFIKPMEINFGIEFNLSNQYALVDGIIQSRAFYLMIGKSTDKVSNKIEESLLVEVPNLGIDKKWNELLNKTLNAKYRNMGLSKKDKQKIIADHIESMRDVWNMRRPE